MQTLAILSRIRLAWPKSTRQVMSAVLVSSVQLEAARPECVIRNPNFPSFHVFTLGVVCFPLLMLLSINLVRWCYRVSRSVSARAFRGRPTLSSTTLDDKLELIESIIFHFWLVSSWSKIFGFIFVGDDGDGKTRTLTQVGTFVEFLSSVEFLTNCFIKPLIMT